MIVIPAIDIKGGKVVRLVQGKFDKVTQYADDPVVVAKYWEKMGAERLHVVDLDGAKLGHLAHPEVIHKIANTVKIPVQVGGGIRGKEIAGILLSSADRVIMGTSAALDKDRKTLKAVIKAWKDRIAISIDCQDGFVALRGWTKKSKIKGIDLAKDMEKLGIKTLIYTDIARDGMLTGPNLKELKKILKAVKISIIASGGIGSLDDVKKLLKLSKTHKNLVGAITGKAIYEEKLNFAEAVKLCSQNG